MDSLAKYNKSLVKNLSQKPASIVEKLLAYYFDEEGVVELTPEEEKLRDRYEEIFTIYSKWRSYDLAIKMIMRMGSDKKKSTPGPASESTLAKKPTISRAQAYRDLKIATRIFGEVKKVSKEARKHIYLEMGHKTYRMAMKAKDIKGMNAAHKNLIMLDGFDSEDSSLPEFENFEQHINTIVVDPVAIGLPSVTQILQEAGVSSMEELMKKFEEKKQKKNILNIDSFQKGE